jgi:flavin-dependent dehydrogenase
VKRVKILGAGPSGLTAAINLAKTGYEVEVFEKGKDVGERFCGDLQGLENWSDKRDILEDLKRMNIDINFDCDPFSKLTITNGQVCKETSTRRPLFYLVKRGSLPGSLDQGLKAQALELGVVIHFRKTIPVGAADIVATGPVQREIPAIAKGITFKTSAEDTSVLLLNNRAAHQAYAYLLVTKGYGCMCSVVIGDPRRINECFEETEKILSRMFSFDIRDPKKVAGIGSFSLESVFENGKTLFAGESAGLQDFLWGFGMRYAIVSGHLAAESIVKNEDYGKIAARRFAGKLKASAVNRYLWEKLGRNEYVFLLARVEFIMSILYSMHNYTLLQRALYPIALSYLRKRYPQLRL